MLYLQQFKVRSQQAVVVVELYPPTHTMYTDQNGHTGLQSNKGERKTQLVPDLGAFGSKAAQSVLQKATTPDRFDNIIE